MQRGSHAFIFADGSSIVSIEELLYKLRLMREDTFSRHVTAHKHDFADWIAHSLEKPGLANLVRGAHDRKSLMMVLDTYLTKLKKHRAVGTFASARTHHLPKAPLAQKKVDTAYKGESTSSHGTLKTSHGSLLEESHIHTVKEEEVSSVPHSNSKPKTSSSSTVHQSQGQKSSLSEETENTVQKKKHEAVARDENTSTHLESSAFSYSSQQSPALSHEEITSFAQALAQHMGPLEKLKQEWHRTHHEIDDMRTKLMELDEHIKEQRFRLRDLIRQRQMLKQSITD